mmetsp:Transcript_12172/g.35008  ORF Transcript_12172/g.35008 Transcript_12172/m.35008 type:complete len:80 (+) Transcript_12172:192-431(+)
MRGPLADVPSTGCWKPRGSEAADEPSGELPMTRFSPGYARAYLMPGPRNLLRLLEAPLFPSPARPCRSQSCGLVNAAAF